MFSFFNKTKMDPTNTEQVLKHIETIHPPEYVQAIKDFLEKKITYSEMQKICSPPQTLSGSSCCEGAR